MSKIKIQSLDGLEQIISVVKNCEFDILGFELMVKKYGDHRVFRSEDNKFRIVCHEDSNVFYLLIIRDESIQGKSGYNLNKELHIVDFLDRTGIIDGANKKVREYLV